MKNREFGEIRNLILKSLEDLGIFVDVNDQDDVNINEYGIDSFTYIAFIVSLEEKLGIAFPDNLMLLDNFSSINGFSNLLLALLDESPKDINTL